MQDGSIVDPLKLNAHGYPNAPGNRMMPVDIGPKTGQQNKQVYVPGVHLNKACIRKEYKSHVMTSRTTMRQFWSIDLTSTTSHIPTRQDGIAWELKERFMTTQFAVPSLAVPPC